MNASIAPVALAVAVLAVVPASAQGPAYRFPDVTTLVGPGSSIGVRVRELTNEEAGAAANAAGGVYIEEVLRDTPAERAGLKPGDVVIEFDGERVRSVRGFTRLVSETPPRRTVKAVVVREGSRRTLDVTPTAGNFLQDGIGRLNQNRPLLRPGDMPVPFPQGRPEYRGWIGVTLETVEGQMADYFGVTAGALVSAVDLNSPASRAGLRAGDVITAAAGQNVRRASDVNDAVRRTRPGSQLELKVVRDRKEISISIDVPTAMRMLL
jgi:serine protease Do